MPATSGKGCHTFYYTDTLVYARAMQKVNPSVGISTIASVLETAHKGLACEYGYPDTTVSVRHHTLREVFLAFMFATHLCRV